MWRFTVVPALRMGVARQQQEVARRAADQIEQFIDGRVEELITAAQIGRLWEMKKESQKDTLYQLFKLDPHIDEIRLIDPKGRESLRFSRSRVYTDADLTSLAQDEKFQRAMKGELYVGPVYHARTSEPYVTLAVPIRFTATEIKGVIITEVTLKSLWDAISYIKVGKSGHAFIVDEKGNLIGHSEYSKALLGMSLSHLHEVREFLTSQNQDLVLGEEVMGESGQRVISSFASVKGRNWAVVVEEPVETALAETRMVGRLGIFLLVVVTSAAFLISYFFSERIARPIRQLEQGARLIAQGELKQKLNIHTGDEIESLAHQFNQMAQALNESYHGLEEKIAERARDLSALYAAMAPLASSDPDQLLQKVLDRLKEVTGADAALIRIFDKDVKSFLYPAHIGFPSSYLEATRIVKADSAIGTAFITGKPIIAADIAEDLRLKSKRQLAAGFRSCAFLPLRFSGELRGMIHLASRLAGHFSEEKTEHLMTIARQMAIALENRELFEESERRAKDQAALSAVAMTASQALQLDEFFDVVLAKVAEVTGRERMTIRLKDAVTGEVRLQACRGLSPEEIETLLRMTQHGASDQVFASGQAVVINDVTENAGLPFVLRQSHSIAWVPIKARAKVVGILGISAVQSVPFESRELELLQAIGNVIGVALENGRLFEETQHNLERIQALREIDQAITSTLHLRTVLDVLMEKIDLVLPYSATTVRLFNQKSGLLEPVACRNLDEAEWRSGPGKAGRGLANAVLRAKIPMMVKNAQADSRVEDPEFYRKHKLTSYLGVPLIAKEEALGVLGFYTREEREFSKEETEFLSTLASQAAIAIQNSRLYEQLKNQAADLEKANKGKDEFLSVISHELRTPLNVIKGYTDMLQENMFGEVSSDQAQALEKISRSSMDLLAMVDEILQATQIEAQAIEVKTSEIKLSEFMDDLKAAYEIPLTHNYVFKWDYPSDLPVMNTDVQKLKQILQNLINNAIKFTECGAISVMARATPESEAVEFKVMDTGIGIAEENLSRIFEMFQQVDSSATRLYGGVGLGLYIVKSLTEMLGGAVDVVSEPNEGSTFTVTVPVLTRNDERRSSGVRTCMRNP
jgi:signal transduction histidine kinase